MIAKLLQTDQPWFIDGARYLSYAGGVLETMRELAPPVAASRTLDERYKDLSDYAALYINQRPASALDENGIGRMSILGPVAQNLAPYEKIFMTDLADIRREAAELVGQGARGLFVQADTPGGTITGTPETAAAIAEIAADGIPVAVHADSLLASAGYYALAAADFISASPSAYVGSIGVIIPWVDFRGLWEQLGFEWSPVVSEKADLKGIAMGPSLSESHRGELQRQINAAEDEFRGFVLEHRAVLEDAMRGQATRAGEGLESGLVDYVEDADTAYQRLLSATNRET